MEALGALELSEQSAERLLDLRPRGQIELMTDGYDSLIDAADQFERLRRKLPPIRQVLGTQLAWPVMTEDTSNGNQRWWRPSDGLCPGCGGDRLDRGTVCVLCDRTGLDDVLASLDAHDADEAVQQAMTEAGNEDVRAVLAAVKASNHEYRCEAARRGARTRKRNRNAQARLKGGTG